MAQALRIIVVEDDVLIAMDLAELLIGMGFDVVTIARTETEAMVAAARFQPDLIIVDGNLDEGSGVSAMRQILASGFVPHFYVTGDPAQILKQAPDAITVAKPFNLRGLCAGIMRARPELAGTL